MSAAVGDGVLPLSSAFNLGGVVVVSAVATVAVAVVAVLAEGAALFFGCSQDASSMAKNSAAMSATPCVLGGYSFMCFPRMTNIFLSIRLRKPYYNFAAVSKHRLPIHAAQLSFFHAAIHQKPATMRMTTNYVHAVIFTIFYNVVHFPS